MTDQTASKLVFMHLPKTGGTSLHTMLGASFEPWETCPERFNNLTRWDQADLNGFRYFSGHFDWENIECLQGPKKVITMLRDPADRIISLYYYWRAHSHKAIVKDGLNGPKMAKSLDLVDFLKCREAGIPSAINNVLTRTLIGSVTRDAVRFDAVSSPKDALDAAFERAKGLTAVGFMEAMDRSVAQIFDKLGLEVPSEIPHDRNSKDPDEVKRQGLRYGKKFPITAEVEDELYRLTKVDARLHTRILQHMWPETDLRSPVDFNASSAATANLTRGWHNPEKEGAWMKGIEGRLDFRLRPTAKYTKIGFVVSAFLPDDSLEMTCTITREDGRSISQNFSSTQKSATIPMIVNSELITGKLNTLSFKVETDKSFSPKDFGAKDQRQLSVKLHRIIPL